MDNADASPDLFAKDTGTTGPDDDFATRGFENIGAWILGRKCWPGAGPRPDDVERLGGATSPLSRDVSCNATNDIAGPPP